MCSSRSESEQEGGRASVSNRPDRERGVGVIIKEGGVEDSVT